MKLVWLKCRRLALYLTRTKLSRLIYHWYFKANAATDLSIADHVLPVPLHLLGLGLPVWLGLRRFSR